MNKCKECGHDEQDHMADYKGKEIPFECSYDNPVCDCEGFVSGGNDDGERN